MLSIQWPVRYAVRPDDSTEVVAWKGECGRLALLLEALADDHFSGQATFDAWCEHVMRVALRSPGRPSRP